MESTEAIRESVEKTKDKSPLSFSFYFPTRIDYTVSPQVIEKLSMTSKHSIGNIAKVSHSHTSLNTSTYLPREIEGAQGTYEILAKITLETAKELQSQTGLVVPFELGKETAEFIGNKGHFGQLRLGKETKSGRYYGIKQIVEKEKVKESLEEAKLQRGLNGLTHLMPLVDAVELKDDKGNTELYHIMPLAALGNGKELASYLANIKDSSFKEALLIHVAKGILKGFKELQERNIAHLDFKPDNLVVDVNGNILVIDFGCALVLDEKGYVKGRNLGDTRYYSPERNAASESFPGKTNDCYTLGLTLLELAVGMIVKKGSTPQDYLNHPYLRNALPQSYAALVKGLLKPIPKERLTLEAPLQWPLFSTPTSTQILSYLKEFVQSIQWEQRVKAYRGAQQDLTSAQQLPLPHFTGYVHRSIEAKVLEKLLAGSNNPIACTGIGGVGKTQLLTYLVHTPEVQSKFSRIFWFRAADNETSLNIQYYGLAKELKLIEDKTPLEAAKKALMNWFEQQSNPCLLVFDNADNPETLKPYLPKRGGSILLSSRFPEWPEAISIELLSITEVQEMMSKLLPESQVSLEEAKELGKILGYLPLALTQAIAMIRQENISIKDYIENFKKKQKVLLSADIALFGKHLPHSMFTLYQWQLEKLKGESPEAIQLLQYSALLAPDAIPIELMKGLLDEEVSIETYQKAQQSLIQYALWQLKENGLYIHRLMQEVVLLAISNKAIKTLFKTVTQKVMKRYNLDFENVLEKEACQKALFPSLEALKQLEERFGFLSKSIEWIKILEAIGVHYHYYIGQPQIAKNLLESVLAFNERQYGKGHPQTGMTLNSLGNACGALGDYEKQRDLLRRSLAIKEKHYGKDHPQTGITLTNLGIVYGSLGDYEKERDYLLRALIISEKHYGKDHPQTGITLDNLGNAYGSLGEYKKQKDYLLRALIISEKHYGKDHPKIGVVLNNLGNAYGALGEHVQKRELLLRALAIHEKHYGKDHPQTGITLTNLGNVHGDLGEYDKQRELLLKAFVINEKYYGTEHSQTGATLTNLGNAHGDLGEYEKQRDYLLRALMISEKHYGKEHPETGNTLESLGNSYGNLGDYEKKRDTLLRALAITEKHYSKDHPKIGIVLNNLGNAYGNLGDYEKKRDLLLRALAIIEKHYGKDRPETGTTLANLGNVHGALGEYEKERELLLKALEIDEKYYGKEHSETGMTLTYLGDAYFNIKDVKSAYVYQKRAYDIFLKFYGPENQWTKYSAQQLQALADETSIHNRTMVNSKAVKSSTSAPTLTSIIRDYRLKDDSQVELEKGLRMAALNNRLEDLDILIQAINNINAQNMSAGETALHIALKKGHIEFGLKLLKSKANPTIKSQQGDTALHCAAANNQVKVLEWLLIEGISLELVNNQGYTPLHQAAYQGCQEAVEYLLQKGADPLALTLDHKTPAQLAYEYGQEAIAKLIEVQCLSLAKDLSIKLRQATANPEVPADVSYRALVTRAIALNVHKEQSSNGNTAFHWALLKKQTDKLLILLTTIAKEDKEAIQILFIKNKEGKTLLDLMESQSLPKEAYEILERIKSTHEQSLKTIEPDLPPLIFSSSYQTTSNASNSEREAAQAESKKKKNNGNLT